jgi:hypothetical protein
VEQPVATTAWQSYFRTVMSDARAMLAVLLAKTGLTLHLVSYGRAAYRRWLGSRPDSQPLRTAWAALRADQT